MQTTTEFTHDSTASPMLTHIVIFTWVPDVKPQQIAEFGDALTKLATDLADLVVMRHGKDLRIREGNGDYALVGTFRDRAGWDAYQAHPLHKAFVREFVMPMQANRLTIQFHSAGA
jgi:hypothetical protein